MKGRVVINTSSSERVCFHVEDGETFDLSKNIPLSKPEPVYSAENIGEKDVEILRCYFAFNETNEKLNNNQYNLFMNEADCAVIRHLREVMFDHTESNQSRITALIQREAEVVAKFYNDIYYSLKKEEEL